MPSMRVFLIASLSLPLLSALTGAAPVRETSRLSEAEGGADVESELSSLLNREKSTLVARDFKSTGFDKSATFYQSLFTSSVGDGIETSITVGGQTLNVLVDTSSPVTWVATPTTQCLDSPAGSVISQELCHFGPVYQPARSTSEANAGSASSRISYPDGSVVKGRIVYEKVNSGGLTVQKQKILVADSVYWAGDKSYAGVLGLGDPNYLLTLDKADQVVINELSFPPNTSLLTTFFTNDTVSPVFSLAIERSAPNASAGFLAFGGLPPVSTGSQFVDTSIIPTFVPVVTGSGKPELVPIYSNFTIVPDTILYEDKKGQWISISDGQSNGSFPVDVQAGSALNFFPADYSQFLNSLFSPPAKYASETGSRPVSCNATAPTVAIEISSQTFVINPVDLIVKESIDPSDLILKSLDVQISDGEVKALLMLLESIDRNLGNNSYMEVLMGIKKEFAAAITGAHGSQTAERMLDGIFEFLANVGVDVLGDILEGHLCFSGIADTPSGGRNILGDVFLKNVVAVFDLKDSQVWFASRADSTTSS